METSTEGRTAAGRLPVVAIVGRPNVGKSTLFNRIVGRRLAITEDEPGTTRDRLYADCTWEDSRFLLVDTAGIGFSDGDLLSQSVHAQVDLAMEQADLILFVIDAAAPLTSLDDDIAARLRQSDTPVILVANKVDNDRRLDLIHEAHALALGDPVPISAYHGRGVQDLLDLLVPRLPWVPADAPEDESVISVAIVGRPNVGKSQLLNSLLGEERAVVSNIAGTTRDAIDTLLTVGDQTYRLIDTAGIRKRGAIVPGVEKYSVLRSVQAINRASVVLLLLDAQEPGTAQDLHVAGYAKDAHKAVIVLVNKWDLIERDETTAVEFRRFVQARMRFMPYVPILFVSALTGYHVPRILDEVRRIAEGRRKRVSTAEVNRVVQRAVRSSVVPSERGRHLNVLYATQTDIDPPTFHVFVNDPALVHFSYRRYLENELREGLGFGATPLRLVFRRRESDRDR